MSRSTLLPCILPKLVYGTQYSQTDPAALAGEKLTTEALPVKVALDPNGLQDMKATKSRATYGDKLENFLVKQAMLYPRCVLVISDMISIGAAN